jgi:ankyrin repeat protein
VAGPVCGVVAESRAERASYARTYFRCTVQGKTALIRAAENGEEAQLKQLIDAKANLHAKDVIYRCCARVSLS